MERPRRPKPSTDASKEPRPVIPLPAETLVDADLELHMNRQLRTWVDEAFEEFSNKGGFDDLPGKGKPLVVPTGDPLASILKNAKTAHPWILLRNDIRDSMELALDLMESGADSALVDKELQDINAKIAQLNFDAPSLSLHKKRVTRENLKSQLESWA